MKQDLAFFRFVLSVAIILILIFPEKSEDVFAVSFNFFIEMILILPAIVMLMGLFTVFVPRDLVVRYLGKESGIRGIFVAMLMGLCLLDST